MVLKKLRSPLHIQNGPKIPQKLPPVEGTISIKCFLVQKPLQTPLQDLLKKCWMVLKKQRDIYVKMGPNTPRCPP